MSFEDDYHPYDVPLASSGGSGRKGGSGTGWGNASKNGGAIGLYDDGDRGADGDKEKGILPWYLLIKDEIIKRERKKRKEEDLFQWLSLVGLIALLIIFFHLFGVFKTRSVVQLLNLSIPTWIATIYLGAWMTCSKLFSKELKKAEEKYDDLKKRLQWVAYQRICQHESECECKEKFFRELEEAGIIIYY